MSKLEGISYWVKQNKRFTVFLVSIAMIVVCWGRIGVVVIDTGLLLFSEIIIIAVLGGALFFEWRHKTHKVVMKDVHNSYKNYYDTTDGYRIIPIGSVDAGDWSWNGGQGTIIAPVNLFMKLGNEMIGFGRPVKTELSKLPQSVRRLIESSELDGVGPPYMYTQTSVLPLTVYNAGAMFIDELKAKHPSLGNGGDLKVLENFQDLEREWKNFTDKKVMKLVKKEFENQLALMEAKNQQLEQQNDFLGKIIDNRGEVMAKMADTAAAQFQVFNPRRMQKYVVKEHPSERGD